MFLLTLPYLFIWLAVSSCAFPASPTWNSLNGRHLRVIWVVEDCDLIKTLTKNEFSHKTQYLELAILKCITILASLAWQTKRFVRAAQRGRISRIHVDQIEFHVIKCYQHL
jgi:hypothetical protein